MSVGHCIHHNHEAFSPGTEETHRDDCPKSCQMTPHQPFSIVAATVAPRLPAPEIPSPPPLPNANLDANFGQESGGPYLGPKFWEMHHANFVRMSKEYKASKRKLAEMMENHKFEQSLSDRCSRCADANVPCPRSPGSNYKRCLRCAFLMKRCDLFTRKPKPSNTPLRNHNTRANVVKIRSPQTVQNAQEEETQKQTSPLANVLERRQRVRKALVPLVLEDYGIRDLQEDVGYVLDEIRSSLQAGHHSTEGDVLV